MLIYDVSLHEFKKDLYSSFSIINSYIKKDKLINAVWLKKSGLIFVAKKQGYNLIWVNQRNITERKSQGYQIIYQLDKNQQHAFRLINKYQQVLMSIKVAEYSAA